MRNQFNTQLEELNNDLIMMGALCEDAIACVTKALNNGDMTLAESAVKTKAKIDQKEREIENLCLKLLLQQQPVAKDLRLISSAMKMITDMERIGDHAADIAEIISFINLTESKNDLHIAEMAEATIKMVTDSIDAFVKRDLDLTNYVIDYDDVVDDLFKTIKKDLTELISEKSTFGEQAIDILMAAKHLEHIGDHAVNIAKWVAFAITGIHK